MTRDDFIAEAQSLIDLIEERGADDLGDREVLLNDYGRRIDHLRGHTVGQFWGGHGGQAASAYMLTLHGLRSALNLALGQDGHVQAAHLLRRLTSQLRRMEAQLKELEPRTASLSSMVQRVEQAYTAADQLPTDLQTLAEARERIAALARDAEKDSGKLNVIRESAEALSIQLKASEGEAKAVLERCETAYSAATSVGLAAAFTERSKALSHSMWIWVGGLIAALGAGSYFGSVQLNTLSGLFNQPDVTTSVVILNLMLSLLSVGAPVWFAWLATKQIGQRFRLAEDYGFKASVSRAYEGYRREAARVDKDMEARLLASALDRLGELPLRLVEHDSHGSPWHELASSDAIKQAMRLVPGFAEQVKDLAGKAIGSISGKRKPVAATDDAE